jgi:FkbH-like protein
MKYLDILQANKGLEKGLATSDYTITVLSNVIVTPFEEVLRFYCLKNGIKPKIEFGNYNNIVQDSYLVSNHDLVIIFFDALNLFEGYVNYFEGVDEDEYVLFVNKFKDEINTVFSNLSGNKSIVFNSFSTAGFPVSATEFTKAERLVEDLNSYLEDNCPKNFTILDLNKIFKSFGASTLIDFRFLHTSKAPYTFSFFQKYADELEHVILRDCGKLKKAIIFDCDNTLWKGILGEDGPDGIDLDYNSKIGRYYSLVQKLAVYLSKRGVIVGLCSKNNEVDVINVINSHPHMVLREENIVIHRINWHDKASNLIDMAKKLNISLDSFVFVDDSSFEINLVNEHLPQVATFHVPSSPYLYFDQLFKVVLKYFNLDVTFDDLRRTLMYREQELRSKEQMSFNSIDDYLSSLEMEIEVKRDCLNEVDRLSQLSQKTNQFNLTTVRYTERQIEQFILSEDFSVYSLSVKDKFGESGITGLAIIRSENQGSQDSYFVDTFLMSCRVIGRNVEYVFFKLIIEDLKSRGIEVLSAKFVRTAKNDQVSGMYDSLGFCLIDNLGVEKLYKANLLTLTITPIPYIRSAFFS